MCKGDIVEDRALKEAGVNGREYSPTRRTRDNLMTAKNNSTRMSENKFQCYF
jgi:hypothetical protein